MKNMLTSPLGRAVLVLSLSCAAPIVMAQADKPTEQEPTEFKGWCKYRWDTNKPIPPRLNLPSWACEIAEDRKLHLRYDINTKINPFYLTGDFDADGKLDVAVRVQEKKSKKIGLVIMHGDKRLFVLWAGTPFEGRNNDDDLSYSDQWSIIPRGEVLDSHWEEGRKVTLKGDAPLVMKSEASGFALYWDGKRYSTYQLSD
jgi:hypothetical protein